MSTILCENLNKKYRMNGITVHALVDINLEIKKGEFAAIAGPSGSGKTTLLNIIGGLDDVTDGNVILGDTRINDLSSKETAEIRLNKIGFVFQAYNLLPVLSALENVEYVLLLQGIGKKERFKRSKHVLKEVGLEKELHRKPFEMSGGQQQRVAVARAIVSNPEIVLADEPTANLDQKTGERLLSIMKKLNKNRNITFLFSTHDSMVMKQSKRLIQLSDGMIVSDETK